MLLPSMPAAIASSLLVCACVLLCVAVDVSGLRHWGARRRAAGAAGRDSSKPRVVEALALPDTKGAVTLCLSLLSG
jgi:hypothetical protein